jgi:V/A-type H+-transporting ATPase subunit K
MASASRHKNLEERVCSVQPSVACAFALAALIAIAVLALNASTAMGEYVPDVIRVTVGEKETTKLNAGESAVFDGTALVRGGNVTYTWNFGDGNTAKGSVVSHKFAQGGEYKVTLTVANETGSDHSTVTVMVTGYTNTQAMVAIGAGIAIGIAGIGSSLGIGIAGAAGIGACAEKPERFGKSLVLQALPMTQGIYGLLTAILLLMGIGLLGGVGIPSAAQADPIIGVAAVGIGLAVGLTGISAIGQGITAGASIGGTARNPEVFSKGLIFTVMSETLAIFGLLVAILIMSGLRILG